MADHGPHVRDAGVADFAEVVLQRSREVPVVVDFWAEWCGPCKVLGPLLEQAASDHDGAFELVKVDVDANQELAMQFGVQGIPTVVAFRDGAPISRFTGAIPSSALDSWLGEFLPTEFDALIDQARDAVLAGETTAAEGLFGEVLATKPDNLEAGTGLASLLIARGATEEALQVLARLSPHPDVERLQAAARLSAARDDDVPTLEQQLETNPADGATRLELARALAARGEFEPGLDHLLHLVRDKGEHMDDARLAMLDIFGVLGEQHPLTATYRRQLASALF